MIYPSVDNMLKERDIDSKYTLSVLAAKRAREIIQGCEVFVASQSSKPVTVALEEIAQGKISFQRTKTGVK